MIDGTRVTHKVHVVGGDFGVERMFLAAGWILTSSIDTADLVQFTGGADVTPALYNQHKHPQSYYSAERDTKERLVFDFCLKNELPMAGICRGGQFLNVMNGGEMYQDVDNHGLTGGHDAHDQDTGEVFEVTSTHHQMMKAGPKGHVFLVAYESTYREWMTSLDQQRGLCRSRGPLNYNQAYGGPDTEGVFYNDTRCLCFQPHPEYRMKGLAERYFRYLEKFLDFKQ